MPDPNSTVLITGGAGYVGSHAVLALREKNHDVVVLDDFSRGSRETAAALDVPVEEGKIEDSALVLDLIRRHRVTAIMHFAALAYVGESAQDPQKYYNNNVAGTLSLLSSARSAGVNRFIFSSTCATYGSPENIPIAEDTPQNPINPYGRTKLMVEQILRDFDSAYGLRSVVFRYFNAAGAHPSGKIGECHDPETHLIPVTLQATDESSPPLKILGTDYPTPDGTCIRDYIHVSDIAAAHVLGLDYLLNGGASDAFNIGTGKGYSVREVIGTVEQVTGRRVHSESAPRRPGDPPILVADPSKIKKVLRWAPNIPDISGIVGTAWKWHQRRA